MGDEVWNATSSFLNGKGWDHYINYTYRSLIPKVKNLSVVSKFRPISLWNILHKFVSEVCVSGLKNVHLTIISSNQYAFFPGKFIIDNVMGTYEALHTMKTRQKEKIESMTLNL